MKPLFSLLPAVHRLRDAAEGDPLRALLTVITREAQRVEDDISRLYDNWFIETCDEWVVPYIADLLGVRALPGGASPDQPAGFSQRSYVANTLAYRRRKGTAAVLEQLAQDITGWRCKAVEFFARTASTQHVNHPRPGHRFTLDVRGPAIRQYDTPFDTAAHLAEVRHIDNARGKYNVPNVGLFLWRLQSYLLRGVAARRIDARRYMLDPLGRDVALFNLPQTEPTVTQATGPANVPMPFSRLMLHDDLAGLYGDGEEGRSLVISVNGAAQPVGSVAVCNLSSDGAEWAHAAPAGKIAIDPELGRVAFDLAPPSGAVTANFAYGFGGDLGGGPYDRAASLEPALRRGVAWQMGVSHAPPPGQSQIVATLGAAIAEWNEQPAGVSGVIALMDNRSYHEDLNTAAKRIEIPEGSQLVIAAAGWPAELVDGTPVRRPGRLAASETRTHLQGTIEILGTAPPDSPSPGRLIVNGVLLEGALKVLEGNLGGLDLAHSTLAPGASTLACAANPGLAIDLSRTICGSLTPGAGARSLSLTDCIVDGDLSGIEVRIESSTIFATTSAQTLHASNSILLGKVTTQRRQEGCVRFCYLPLDSESPRRHRCQPDEPAHAARVRPRFESVSFGEPAYALLAGSCAAAIVSGADDEGEMGAWHFVQAPLRLRNLRVALDEYLRFGLEAGVFMVPQQPQLAAEAVRRERGGTSRTRGTKGPRAAKVPKVTKTKVARDSKVNKVKKKTTKANPSKNKV